MTGPRIAFVINSLEGGGAERVASLLLAEFAGSLREEFGFDIHLVLLDDAPRKYPVPPTVTVHVLDARKSLLRSIFSVRRALRRIDADVCLSFLTRANISLILGCGRRPCLISERVNTTSHFGGSGLHDRLGKFLVRLLYPRADRVIAVSEGVAEDLALRHGVRRDRLTIIHNPYDLVGILRAAEEAPPPGVLPDGPFFVSVGRLTRNKNVPLLLDAYAASGVPQDLVILGEGEERAALKARADALGLGGRVRFPGFLANPYPVVVRADAFVSASDAEGFPNAAAEAMALGRPVVMTDCPSGPSELLVGRAPQGAGLVRAQHGLLTPPGDRDALVEAMRALCDPTLRAELGACAMARMRNFRLVDIPRRYAETIMAAIRAYGVRNDMTSPAAPVASLPVQENETRPDSNSSPRKLARRVYSVHHSR